MNDLLLREHLLLRRDARLHGLLLHLRPNCLQRLLVAGLLRGALVDQRGCELGHAKLQRNILILDQVQLRLQLSNLGAGCVRISKHRLGCELLPQPRNF